MLQKSAKSLIFSGDDGHIISLIIDISGFIILGNCTCLRSSLFLSVSKQVHSMIQCNFSPTVCILHFSHKLLSKPKFWKLSFYHIRNLSLPHNLSFT
jgi:hypothetical protein